MRAEYSPHPFDALSGCGHLNTRGLADDRLTSNGRSMTPVLTPRIAWPFLLSFLLCSDLRLEAWSEQAVSYHTGSAPWGLYHRYCVHDRICVRVLVSAHQAGYSD
jgi:hypothetical protein